MDGNHTKKEEKEVQAKDINENEDEQNNKEENKISYKEVDGVDPLSKNYSIKTLIKLSEEKFIGFSTDNIIGVYNFDKRGIKYKSLESPIFLNFVIKLSDNRFLNCFSTEMEIFSIDFEKEKCHVEQEIELSKNEEELMCIELSNGNLISTGIFKGSLSIWTKNKDNQCTLLKKKIIF